MRLILSFAAVLLVNACTVNAPINVDLPDPFGHPDMAHAAPADMAQAEPVDMAPIMCGVPPTACETGRVCWHNNCLLPCEVPDSDMGPCTGDSARADKRRAN